MENQFYSEKGPWTPLPRPIPIPSEGVYDGNQVTICFNETWLPAVLSALSVLARPETYDSSDPTSVYDAAREGSQLSLSGKNPCINPCAAFYASQSDVLECTDSPSASLIELNVFAGCGGSQRAYMGKAGSSETGCTLSWEFFRTDAPYGKCGGNIRYLAAATVDNVIAPVWHWAIKDCLGNITTYDHTGNFPGLNNVVCQEVCLSCSDPYVMGMVLDGPVECGVA